MYAIFEISFKCKSKCLSVLQNVRPSAQRIFSKNVFWWEEFIDEYLLQRIQTMQYFLMSVIHRDLSWPQRGETLQRILNTWSCETSPIIFSLHLLHVMSCMIFSEPNCMKFWGQPRSSMHPLRFVSCVNCSPESSIDRVLASSCQGRFCCISISTALLSIYRDSSYQGCCTYSLVHILGCERDPFKNNLH